MEKDVSVSGAAEGERSSTGAAPEVKRWSANHKREVVLRLMRDEPIDALSRELGIEIYRLEEWHQKALQGTTRRNNPAPPIQVGSSGSLSCIFHTTDTGLLRREDILLH